MEQGAVVSETQVSEADGKSEKSITEAKDGSRRDKMRFIVFKRCHQPFSDR